MKCEYPKCDAKAIFKLSLADPDAEGSYYCQGHIKNRRREILMELFTGDWKCKATTNYETQCLNSKRYGDYCGIHHKARRK